MEALYEEARLEEEIATSEVLENKKRHQNKYSLLDESDDDDDDYDDLEEKYDLLQEENESKDFIIEKLSKATYESAASRYEDVSEYSSSESVSNAMEEPSDQESQLQWIKYQQRITENMNQKQVLPLKSKINPQ